MFFRCCGHCLNYVNMMENKRERRGSSVQKKNSRRAYNISIQAGESVCLVRSHARLSSSTPLPD